MNRSSYRYCRILTYTQRKNDRESASGVLPRQRIKWYGPDTTESYRTSRRWRDFLSVLFARIFCGFVWLVLRVQINMVDYENATVHCQQPRLIPGNGDVIFHFPSQNTSAWYRILKQLIQPEPQKTKYIFVSENISNWSKDFALNYRSTSREIYWHAILDQDSMFLSLRIAWYFPREHSDNCTHYS